MDWSNWGEEDKQEEDNNSPDPAEIPAEELFRDMEPVMKKTQVVSNET